MFGGLLEHYLPLKGNHDEALEHPAQTNLFVDDCPLARECVACLRLALAQLAHDRWVIGSYLHPKAAP
jgi:hypothetical protein